MHVNQLNQTHQQFQTTPSNQARPGENRPDQTPKFLHLSYHQTHISPIKQYNNHLLRVEIAWGTTSGERHNRQEGGSFKNSIPRKERSSHELFAWRSSIRRRPIVSDVDSSETCPWTVSVTRDRRNKKLGFRERIEELGKTEGTINALQVVAFIVIFTFSLVDVLLPPLFSFSYSYATFPLKMVGVLLFHLKVLAFSCSTCG